MRVKTAGGLGGLTVQAQSSMQYFFLMNVVKFDLGFKYFHHHSAETKEYWPRTLSQACSKAEHSTVVLKRPYLQCQICKHQICIQGICF